MRMFQSVSRHSSEQSTAHNSSQPTLSPLKGVTDTISIWFENHRPQRTQISPVSNAPFRSKLESNGLQVDRNRKFSERIFQLLQYPGQHPSLSAHWADLMSNSDSTFPAFSFRIVDFAVQFLLRCKSSFHEKGHSSQVWQWRDLPKPITILCQRTATNRIASFCMDHRWHQMAFFVFVKMGKVSASMRTKFNSLLYKTNRFHDAVHLSSNRSHRTSECGKNFSDTLGYRFVCHFFAL